jgi:N-acyl-D-aspartate/D-glutamate deacylase
VPLDQITIAWTAAKDESLLGMTVAEFVAQRGKPVEEALIDLLIDSNLGTLMVVGSYDKDYLVESLIAHDLAILGSDGIYCPGGHVHPRVFGSAGRWMGSLVRDHKVQSLEQAVHKASGKAAGRFGLTDRGVIRQGAFADLVVIDSTTIADRATYDQPQQECVGVETVIVNGRSVISKGKPANWTADSLPGRRLRASQAPV